MKKVLLSLLLILMLLTSCDLAMKNAPEVKPKIYFVGIGLDYKTWNRNSVGIAVSALDNTENDLKAITAQFRQLAIDAGYEYRFVTYDDFASASYGPETDKKYQYRFMFNSYTGKNGKDVEDESLQYVYKNIAHTNQDGTPNEVKLYDFAEDFSSALNDRITNGGTETPTADDIMIFYYTGHGIENGLGPAIYYQTGLEPNRLDEELMLPCASEESQKANGENYIIPIPYLYLDKYVFSEYRDSTIITLFDCCYSGYAIDNSDLGSIENFKTNAFDRVRDDKREVPSINSIFTNTYNATFGDSPANKNIYHLTAAHATQVSFDKDMDSKRPNQDAYGAFTYQVLSYLDYDFDNNRAGNHRKKVYSINEMYAHVYNNISYDTKTYATPNVTRSRFDYAIFMM